MFRKIVILSLLFSLSLAQQIGLNECALLATPQNNIVATIERDINKVGLDGYIGIESIYLINNRIINALKAAAQRGATVRAIVDEQEYNENHYRYQDLPRFGIEVLPIAKLHAKRIVIDNRKNNPNDAIVYLGSMNFTEHAPNNLELMARCKDRVIFITNLNDQQGLYESPLKYKWSHHWEPRFYHYPNFDLTIQTTFSSLSRNAQQAKLNLISEFPNCHGENDYLYIASLSLDDPQIIEAISQAALKAIRPIILILDGSVKNYGMLNDLSRKGIQIYLYNPERETTDRRSIKLFHMKTILRVCNGTCTAIISTGNLTKENRSQINHDLLIPCSSIFASRLKQILEEAIKKSSLYINSSSPQ